MRGFFKHFILTTGEVAARALGLWVSLGFAVLAQAASFQAVVTHVSDGDTVWVQPLGQVERLKIRIQGIDAPEICQTYGVQSQQVLSSWVMHRTVTVQTSRRDTYGRWLARLWDAQGNDMAAQLVAEGYAWSYRYRRDQGPYMAEQLNAQAEGRGLWAYGSVQEPRQFRRQHGSCQ
jgi:micrococcal nuclease